MQVKELRAVLEELRGILAAANAKSQSKDIATFLALFDGADEAPVDQFLRDLEQRLEVPEAVQTVPVKLPDRAVVVRHVTALRAADTDKGAFDAAFAQLKRDADIDKAEAEAIAFEYIGYADGRRAWPSKKSAMQAIEDWFKRLAYDAVRAVQLDKARYVG